MNGDCGLCKIGDPDRVHGNVALPTYSLMRTRTFHVVPSLGSLVAGWVMIVTRDHRLCMGELSDQEFRELVFLKEELSRELLKTYGRLIVFEHGPSSPGTPVGCGVDHAHLHLVPVDIDVIEAIPGLAPTLNLEWCTVSDIREARSYFLEGVPYLYVEQAPSFRYITTHKHLPSQLIRRVIAKHIGRPGDYDWQQYPYWHNMVGTIGSLAPLSAQASEISSS